MAKNYKQMLKLASASCFLLPENTEFSLPDFSLQGAPLVASTGRLREGLKKTDIMIPSIIHLYCLLS
jgi:hypothetical protein